jgi:hypothetical protein
LHWLLPGIGLTILGLAYLKIKPIDANVAQNHSKQTPDETPQAVAPINTGQLRMPEVDSNKSADTKRAKVPDLLKFVVNFLTLLAVVYYASEARKQRVATEETNTLTGKALANSKEQLRITVRPWVGPIQEVVSLKSTPVQFDSKGNASISYQLPVQNFGSIPAQNVMPSAQLVVTNNLKRVLEAEAVACGGNRKSDPRIGFVLFPQGIMTGEGGSFYEQSKMIIPGNSDGKVTVFMVSCTTYRDQFGCSYGTKATYRLGDPRTKRGVSFYPKPNTFGESGIFILMNGALDDQTCIGETQIPH